MYSNVVIFVLALLSLAHLGLSEFNKVIVPFTLYGSKGEKLNSRRLMGLQSPNSKSISLHFDYDGEAIECNMTEGRAVITQAALARINVTHLPKIYEGEFCSMSFLDDEIFDGLAISHEKAIHFHRSGINDIEIQTDTEGECLSYKPEEKRRLSHKSTNMMRMLNDVQRWSNCYYGDNQGYDLNIGVGVGTEFRKLHSNNQATIAFIQSMLVAANQIYSLQVNIRIVVDYVWFPPSGSPSWDNPNCAKTLDTQFHNWKDASKPEQKGLWELIDGCYGRNAQNGNIAGVAWIGTLCSGNGYNTGVTYCSGSCSNGWLTLAHEIGHNFNAQHSFEEGLGSTGGIMDYGNGKLNGIYQFNTRYRKNEVCSELNSVVRTCPHFQEKSSSDGIDDSGESDDPEPPLAKCGKFSNRKNGRKKKRARRCKNTDTCYWSGKSNRGRGKCARVLSCNDVDKFPLYKGERKRICNNVVPFDCAFRNKKCGNA